MRRKLTLACLFAVGLSLGIAGILSVIIHQVPTPVLLEKATVLTAFSAEAPPKKAPDKAHPSANHIPPPPPSSPPAVRPHVTEVPDPLLPPVPQPQPIDEALVATLPDDNPFPPPQVQKPKPKPAVKSPSKAKPNPRKKVTPSKADLAAAAAKKRAAREAAAARARAAAARKAAARRAALARKVVRGASVTSRATPVYPRSARRRGQEGKVIVTVTVAPSGRVTSPRISKSSGIPALDSSALKAAQKFRFQPARNGLGSPVSTKKSIPFTFRLSS